MDQELVDSHAQALYGLPRDEFTAERDRVARGLKADGHRDEAAAVKRLRKPTVPAWAINQLARRHGPEVDALATAGDGLRAAQGQATSGGGSEELRTAARAVRDLVGTLRGHARTILEESGTAADTHLEDVSRTLFAAAVDPVHQPALKAGVFDRPLEATGFGAFDLAAAPAPTAAPAAKKAARTTTGSAAGRRKLGTAGTRKLAATKAATAAPTDAAEDADQRRELRQKRARLQRELQRQQQRVERAETKAADLQSKAEDATTDAEQQRAMLIRLEQALAELGSDPG